MRRCLLSVRPVSDMGWMWVSDEVPRGRNDGMMDTWGLRGKELTTQCPNMQPNR